MKSLSTHDVDALLALLVRIKAAHAITLGVANLSGEERSRLLDETGVIERLLPKLTRARLEARQKQPR
jgi:hypothetical protein